METSDSNFYDFVEQLKKLGLKRVEVNDKTNALKFENKTAINHIFVPNNWQIDDCGLIKDSSLETLTDHKGVYVKVKAK